MAKVIVMDATRSECIEAIRQNKMKKSTYGSEGFPLHECGSDMGYYVQIQEPGGLETTLLEGSKPSTKTKSYAWGRVWYKGSYLKQFSGPINVVRQDIVKYLQQLTTDSHPLKTYKIKNHDSGKTYSVKAVSYIDAKRKYNAHISDALPLVERIGDYEIRKNDDDDLKFAVFYKGQIIAETTTINVAKKEIESHKNDIAKKNDKYNLRRDALTEDEWQYVHYKSKEERELRNLCSKHNVKFGPYVLDKDGFYKARIEGDFDDVHKVNNLWKNYQFNGVLEDSNSRSSYTFKTGLRSDAFKQYLRDRGIYFEPSQDGEYTHFEVKNADEAVDRRANEIVRQLKDALTEDAVIYGEWQENGVWNVNTNDLQETKRELKSAGYKYISHDTNIKGMYYKYTVQYTKDSITEDAYVYPTNSSTSMAASFAKLCVEKFGGKVGSKGGNKYVYIAQDKETANKAKQFLEEKYKTSLPTVKFIVADSITEDADKAMGTYKGYTIKQNVDGDIYVLKKSGEKEFFESWKAAYAAITSGTIKDSITEDSEIAGWIAIYNGTRIEIKKSEADSLYSAKKLAILKFKEKFKNVKEHMISIAPGYNDSITEDANYEEGFSSTKGELVLVVHESIANHLKRKFGGSTSSQKVYGQKQSYWTTTNKSVYESAKKYLSNGFKDSITEDADAFIKETIAELSRYIRNWDFMSAKERNSIMPGYSKSEGLAELKIKLANAQAKLKDSITEDAATNDSHYLESNKQYMTKLWNKKDVFERKYKVAITRQGEGHYIEGSRKNLVSLLQELRGSDFNANPFIHDSLTEDADIAQNDIKSSYLPEDANADNIQYLGFNEKRKLSFYSYGDRYFVHYDLEGRTEEVDKDTVQKILKKNILGEIDENDVTNKEPQSEEIVTDTFESDVGEISIEQFDPKRLVESSKSRKQSLHNEIKMKNGDVYIVFFHASGEIENPRLIWVSIVLEKPSGQQSRVLSEEAETYEQAIQIMNDWKKKQERGDK